MINPFDAATPHIIECFEANAAYYRSGKAKPNYPMPTILARVVYFDDGIEWLQHSQIGGFYVIRDYDYH